MTDSRAPYRTLSVVLLVIGLVGGQAIAVLHALGIADTALAVLLVVAALNVLHGLEVYLRLRAEAGSVAPTSPPAGLHPDKA